jgi:hypothetical protein
MKNEECGVEMFDIHIIPPLKNKLPENQIKRF